MVIVENGKGELRVVKMTSNTKSHVQQLPIEMTVSPNHVRSFNMVNYKAEFKNGHLLHFIVLHAIMY